MTSLADRFRRWYEYERDCNAKSLTMLASVPVERQAYLRHHESACPSELTCYEFAKRPWHYAAPAREQIAAFLPRPQANCSTVGGIATPTAWKTRPQTPRSSLRSRKRLPSCSTSTNSNRSKSWITSAHSHV
jgi:hypothetical protein